MKRILLAILVGVAGLVLIGAVVFAAWASNPSPPMPEALAALETDSEVAVSEIPWLEFKPQGYDPACGFILYPGGRVDPQAYAPTARELAKQGVMTIIVPMPLNLAFFAPGRAGDITSAYPEISTWGIGGHSLGGTMAASFAAGNPDSVEGLILWASYPSGQTDLSDSDLKVASIHGTRDGLIEGSEIEASLSLLPPGTKSIEIEGGNHAQFGWYGEQSGDLPAEITRQEQEAQVVESTLDIFQDLGCLP